MQIAYGRHTDPANAVRQCAAQLSNGHSPELILAFCGGKHPPKQVLDALRRELGPAPIVGGAAAGAITHEGFGYSGFELALGVFSGDVVPQYISTRGLLEGEKSAGAALGRRVGELAGEDAAVVLLYDSVAANTPLRLHPAAPLVQGFYEGLGHRSVHLVGAGLLTDLNLSDGWVFDGEGICKHGAVALVFPRGVRVSTAIMHGCRPVSTFMEITRIEGAEVFELDGKPALHVLEEMLGLTLGTSDDHNLSLLATLGQKHGDPYAPFDENDYVNRLILRANREADSITIFEPDFVTGSKVQIMARDNRLMLESVEQGVDQIVQGLEGKERLMSLYIDCAGRASSRSGSPVEEAEVALKASKPLGPMLGFYSGVEIAPLDGRSFPLDWTAVLSTFYYDR